jgi:hypothetical protein
VGERNVFANGYRGVNVNAGSAASPNWIAGNFFGTWADGTTPGQLSVGVYVRQSAALTLVGSNQDGVSDVLERNVIASCTYGAFFDQNAGLQPNRLVGNWIGLDALGNPAGNVTGVRVDGNYGTSSQDIVANLVRANSVGIRVNGDATVTSASTANCISGNTVGVRHTGTAANLFLESAYWGAANGPSGAGPGSGDSIELTGAGTVDFTPWLTAPDGVCGVSLVVFADGFEIGDPSGWSNVVP